MLLFTFILDLEEFLFLLIEFFEDMVFDFFREFLVLLLFFLLLGVKLFDDLE